MTALYSILHLLVDGVCALAMFGRFLSREQSYIYILGYNFCAFALQMPFGVVLDALQEREKGKERGTDWAFLCAAAGVLCTMAGACTHPMVLGVGNALFHVGGGVGTIREDHARSWKGRGLGVFVAPGALGLYLGTLIGKGELWGIWALGGSSLIALLCAGAACRLFVGSGKGQGLIAGRDYGQERGGRMNERQEQGNQVSGVQENVIRKACRHEERKNGLREQGRETPDGQRVARGAAEGTVRTALCCMLVVILRSYVGMAVSFPWKSGIFAGTMAVLAVVGGKVAGGFGAARYGLFRITVVSLGLSAVCYLASASMPMGLLALFLFNMTMPITLYELVRSMPRRPGFAFGGLTFALFLGFLPVYFGAAPVWEGNVLGCVGSLASLLLLAAGIRVKGSGLRIGGEN